MAVADFNPAVSFKNRPQVASPVKFDSPKKGGSSVRLEYLSPSRCWGHVRLKFQTIGIPVVELDQ